MLNTKNQNLSLHVKIVLQPNVASEFLFYKRCPINTELLMSYFQWQILWTIKIYKSKHSIMKWNWKGKRLEGGGWKKKCRWHFMWTCVPTQITHKPRQLLELIIQKLVGHLQYHYLRHSYLQYSTRKCFHSLTSLWMLFANKELKDFTALMKYLWTDPSLSSNTLNLHVEVSSLSSSSLAS